MRVALLAVGLIPVTAAAWVAPQVVPALHAQESPRLASLEVAIWPEFDRQAAVLVILRGELADEVLLPATVAVRIPTSSGGPSAVASAAAQTAPLLDLEYDLTEAEDSLLLTITTPDPHFQIEFYEPLRVDIPDRSYTYVWPGDLGVDQLTVVVQEPMGATDLSTEPELDDASVGPDRLVYRSGQMGPIELGENLTLNLRYVKPDPRPSAEILGVGEVESDGGVPLWVIFAVVAAAPIVVAGAVVYWRWQWRPVGTAEAPMPGSRRGRRGASTAGEGSSAQTFCTKCGDRLRPGSRFCSTCGTPTRKE